MAGNKTKKKSQKSKLDDNSEMDHLKQFKEKKRIQNEALKKIVYNLNSAENSNNNKSKH